MNLRTLKKLSKRAVPYLALIGDRREIFLAEADENYTGLMIMDRKHWERGRSVHADNIRQNEIKRLPKNPIGDKPYWIWMAPPSHPKAGTPMVGATDGYYEPEWSEETAWEALRNWVTGHFVDYDPEADCLCATRTFKNPGQVFAAADELIAARKVPA